MQPLIYIAFSILIISQVFVQSSSAVEVTNQQLRDGLISLVHSYSTLENKLERHEQRERALGDVIKRGLQTLQKGQKVFEPMRGTFARLDERMSQIETVVMAQEEKFIDQQIKIANALETIMKWMASNTSPTSPLAGQESSASTTQQQPTIITSMKSSEEDEETEDLPKKIDNLSDNINGLRRQIAELIADKNTADTTSKMLLEQTEKLVNSKLASADEVISRIEEKLTHFYITSPISTSTTTVAPPPQPLHNTEWENSIKSSLSDIKMVMTDINDHLKTSKSTVQHQLDQLNKEFFVTMANETLEAIEDVRLELLTASDKSFMKTASRIQESSEKFDTLLNDVLKIATESEIGSEAFYSGVEKNFTDLKNDIQGLAKMENILLESGDNILAMKRGMEFNVHTIKLEVGDMITAVGKELNSTIHNRFDEVNETIFSNHNGALLNLTSKIETEISQVWRQIGIMYQEVSSSKEALNKLQEQTEAYVNGTFTTMDSMEGKVSQITGRMAEVDSNLNYLLGRLSLVTQEFNQIKTGLGNALDNIRSSFQIVQSKVKDVGPGPHKIQSEENETDDLHLLP